MSKKEKEEESVSKPNISFRADPALIETLKEELGESETASAVRKAIMHTIQCTTHMQHMQHMHQLMQTNLSVSQVASILRKNRSTIVRMIHRGELRAYKVGRAYSIPVSAIDKYLRPHVETQA